LRKPQKTKPLNARNGCHFLKCSSSNQGAYDKQNSLIISLDCKAKVKKVKKVKKGNLSRGGSARTQQSEKADDHEIKVKAKRFPFCIREMGEECLTIFRGKSFETSLIVNCLEQWWNDKKDYYSRIEELTFNLNNGSSCASHRTPFIKRMVEF
jgi:hypothetical protein